MVTITVKRSSLLGLAGKKLGHDELSYKLEQIKCVVEGYDEKADGLSLEITPDRPDLLSVHGIARNLRGTLGVELGAPKIGISDGPALRIFVSRQAAAIRPVMTAAVVEGIDFSNEDIAGLFELQEKINATLGRRRKRVSFGLYDLDKVKPPIHFKTADADKTRFVPLKHDSPMSLRQMVEELPKGRDYAHLLAGHAELPVLEDSSGLVMGLIPIINEGTSAVTQATKRLLIENEGTDEHSCNAALAILCADYAEMGAKVTKVEVVYEGGKAKLTPDMGMMQKMRIGVKQANAMLGASLSAQEMVLALRMQRIDAHEEEGMLECSIPAYRSDFMHPVDLVEEIAIGRDYNSFAPLSPAVFTKGSLSALTQKEQALRDFMVGAGFLELSTYVLTNEEKVRRAKSGEELVEVLNPVSREYNAMRATLLPNLLEVLSENTHVDYPQRLFECGEVVAHNRKLPERMQTKLHLCALAAHSSASLTESASAAAELARRFLGKGILFEKLESPQFIPGRAARVLVDAKPVGAVGEIHPEVLAAWGLQVPVAALEIEIE